MRSPPRFLRILIRLFPPSHRRAYGDEMWEVVCHRFGAARSSPRRVVEVFKAVADLVWNAAGLWMRQGRRMMMGSGSGWGMDLRFVLRSVRRSPGYAATTILVLAGAVAVTASVFSFVRGTLLAAPTYPDAERVVVGWGSNAAEGQVRDVVSGPTFIRLREGMTSLEALAVFHGDDAVLMEDGRPTVLPVHSVSVDFFDVVPVRPYLGRTFGEGDRTSAGQRSVMVSYAFWRDRLGSDATVVGSALPLNDEPHTIVGVLPEGFEFLTPAFIWVPLADDVLAGDEPMRIHYHLIGRLKDGAAAADATRDLTALMQGVAVEFPGFEGWSILVEPLHEVSVMAVRPVLWVTTGAVMLVLLIALVNLATLFRIRTLGRADELGVRRALGADGSRLARVLALEAGGLAVVGAALGLLAAPPLLGRIRDMVPLWINIPDSAARLPVLRASLDPWVAGVAAGVAVLGALLLVTPPVVTAVRSQATGWTGRRFGGSGGTRWLVGAELALATVLCLGAGLTTRSAHALLATDVGLRDEGLLTLYFADVWDQPRQDQVAYYEDVVRQVAALRGVTSAALIDYVPFQGEDDFARIYFLDRLQQPVRNMREEWRRVSYGLFETAGMQLLAGRTLERDDFVGMPRAAVVNESFARKHYAGGDAVGSYISTHNDAYRDLEIVGVVADVRSNGPAAAPPPMLYVPLQGDPRGTTGLYVRVASGDVMAVAEDVREAIWAVDPSQPVAGVLPMTDLVGGWVAIPRAIQSLVAGVAGFALILAGLGVFGVVSFALRSRTAEFGVRLALGASPSQLVHGTIRSQSPMVLLGIGLGLGAGVVAARAARAVIVAVAPGDPLSAGAAAVAMLAAAFLAVYLPARRIARIDPTEAIRAE